MKISIIGGGNMGGAIAYGLASGNIVSASDITVINRRHEKVAEFNQKNAQINAVANDYSSLKTADIIVLAVKPWMMKDVLDKHRDLLNNKQYVMSIAAGISLDELKQWVIKDTPLFRIMPNTAIAIKESMTFVATENGTDEQNKQVLDLFTELGKAQLVEEKLFDAVSSLTSCGIAFAMRYIRAAMEGGVEMGIKANDAKLMVIQTLRGAANLLEHNGTHPEEEIDKVTTPGGITIKGLNEMEHSGFTSAVIRGLKASSNKK